MEKTTLYLPEDLQRDLRAAAKRTGQSQAELIREALRTYLQGLGRPPLRSLGAGRDSKLSAKNSEKWLRRQWKQG